MFFDEKYGPNFGGDILEREKTFPMVVSIGSSLETGLSAKLMLEAEEAIEVNKKTVVEVGKVYKFD